MNDTDAAPQGRNDIPIMKTDAINTYIGSDGNHCPACFTSGKDPEGIPYFSHGKPRMTKGRPSIFVALSCTKCGWKGTEEWALVAVREKRDYDDKEETYED